MLSERAPARSAAAAAASRRNGAASCGPTSPQGKAASSRNARKHGLFTAQAVAGPLSPKVAAILAEMECGTDNGRAWQRDLATIAALRLSRADELVRGLQAELAEKVLDQTRSEAELGELIGNLLRMQRHARRFRGQRDRALRRARSSSAASPSPSAQLDSAARSEPALP